MTHPTPHPHPSGAQEPRSTLAERPPHPLYPDPVDLFQSAQSALTLAAGYAARYFATLDPRADQPRMVLALFQEYTAATDRIFRKMIETPERPTRKLPATRRRPVRKDAVFGGIPIP